MFLKRARPEHKIWAWGILMYQDVVCFLEKLRTRFDEGPDRLATVIWTDHIPKDLQELYEVHDFQHAAAILRSEFPREFAEICEALRRFRITTAQILKPGGSESDIPKRISTLLRPKGWEEAKLSAKTVVDEKEIRKDTHLIDYVKGRVAFDVEWNSKDQTYDRDLFAFRAFFEYDRISVGVLLTRSNDLDEVFGLLGKEVKAKYGASTTQMGKLLPRLSAGRNGGCPVLVFGIRRQLISDWDAHAKKLAGK